ncbi:chorismate mutase [Paludicola sp. MB14-C6]|uniref:chorismate mutase n=1 Tax=Paludihabitans sp. MB14-C6 TaxID=3070656 RepID=UPI0027DCA3AC|nr:chorismate mutase [Paludicola sp. MB14-C6]WMJ22519.1 chorismate mutase [Paludicola sp. MB14-C6]
MNSLEQARAQINQIDKDMAILFEKRMKAVEDVVAFKIENNLPVLDQNREQFVIDKNLAYIQNESYKEYYKEFIQELMNVSKKYQTRLLNNDIIGYQGTQGAFSHIALQQLFPNQKEKSYKTFKEVFQAVESGEITQGILPFENSYTGEVGEVLDLLYQHKCYITKIYDLKINQNLLGVKGTKLTDIKQVYSHHQALSQCKRYFDLYDFELIPFQNTALAAQYVSETNDKTKAAVASTETAKLYELEILVENINTSAENTTRFVVISKNQNKSGNRFNIMFTLSHNAGQLASAMQIISKYNFNMESIQSKSIQNIPWQYYFYVEIIGDASDKNAIALLEELKANCKEIKLLGVYNK